MILCQEKLIGVLDTIELIKDASSTSASSPVPSYFYEHEWSRDLITIQIAHRNSFFFFIHVLQPIKWGLRLCPIGLFPAPTHPSKFWQKSWILGYHTSLFSEPKIILHLIILLCYILNLWILQKLIYCHVHVVWVWPSEPWLDQLFTVKLWHSKVMVCQIFSRTYSSLFDCNSDQNLDTTEIWNLKVTAVLKRNFCYMLFLRL